LNLGLKCLHIQKNDPDLLFLVLEAIHANCKAVTSVTAALPLQPDSFACSRTIAIFLSLIGKYRNDLAVASVVFELLRRRAEAWALGIIAIHQ
jgi:hypothetical protein